MDCKLDVSEKQGLRGREGLDHPISVVGFQKGEEQGHEKDQTECGVLREVPSADHATFCKLCGRTATGRDPTNSAESEEDSMKLGPLYELVVDEANEVYCAHFFCLLFSSALDQNGEEEEGIKGFMPPDILREWRRGQRLKCSLCNKRYATAGCCSRYCRKTFHVPCAIKSDCLLQFCDKFSLFCAEHRPLQKRPSRAKEADGSDIDCGICLDVVDSIGSNSSSLWAPCCGGGFHRTCLETLAESAGYFFKCPLCNNKDDFENEMRSFGIWVPEQDAAWEMEPSAFESLLERHSVCDAQHCLCPRGRDEDVDDTDWEVVLCRCCGSKGIHLGCAKLNLKSELKWTCHECKNVVSKLPPRIVNHYVPFKKSKSPNLKNVPMPFPAFIVKGNSISTMLENGLVLSTKVHNNDLDEGDDSEVIDLSEEAEASGENMTHKLRNDSDPEQGPSSSTKDDVERKAPKRQGSILQFITRNDKQQKRARCE